MLSFYYGGPGVATVSYAEVANYAALPAAATASGKDYLVLASTGVWPLTRKQAGVWRSDGAAWSWLGDAVTIASDLAFTPTGNIASTTAQAAIAEVDLEKEPTITGSGAAGDYWAGTKAFRALDAGMSGVMANGVNISWTYDGVGKTLTPSLIGTFAAARMPAFTGDITSTSGTVATTIANGAVTLPKMANLAANSFMGNNTGAGATPIALTVAQAKTLLAIAEGDVTNLTTDLAAKAPLASPQITGTWFYQQPAPSAINATATLTIAQLLTLIIATTSSTAVSLTLPTGTLTDAGILSGALAVNEAFEWGLINLGSSTGVVTMAAGTAHTLVGLATVAIGTSSRWLTRKTATNTFVTYRLV